MSKITAPLSIGLGLCCLGLFSFATACHQRGGQPAASAPVESAAVDFYRWYLEALAQHREPLDQELATVEKYVSAALISELQRKQALDALSEDYFLKAQDWPDDWVTGISASNPVVKESLATMIVTLGATAETRHRLKVTLGRESGVWKITDVQAAP